MSYGICPACGQEIPFQDTAQVGQNTVCNICHEMLAIVTLNPIILEMYQHSTVFGISKEEKKDSGKKNNLKNKHHSGDVGDNDNKDDSWKREIRKARSRKVNDW